MYLSKRQISDFYKSFLGKMNSQNLSKLIVSQCKNLKKGSSLLGIGFASPYLNELQQKCYLNCICAFSPPGKDTPIWPNKSASKTIIINSLHLPFHDNAFAGLLVIHGLEYSSDPKMFMKELWRICEDDGILTLVLPNRRGIWSFFDNTPFGQGRPYSPSQIEKLLGKANFVIEEITPCLFTPPINSKSLYKFSHIIESIGKKLLSHFGGVMVIKARKKIYSPCLSGNAEVSRDFKYATFSKDATILKSDKK